MNVRVESNSIYYLVQHLYYTENLKKDIWLRQVTMSETNKFKNKKI